VKKKKTGERKAFNNPSESACAAASDKLFLFFLSLSFHLMKRETFQDQSIKQRKQESKNKENEGHEAQNSQRDLRNQSSWCSQNKNLPSTSQSDDLCAAWVLMDKVGKVVHSPVDRSPVNPIGAAVLLQLRLRYLRHVV
jgi:hypothetical protein